MMQPTIGHKVYFNPHDRHPEMRRLAVQPLDATVVFVHEDGSVNLLVVDHIGIDHPVQNVPFVQPGQEAPDNHCAHWMPAQLQIAKQQEFVAAAITDYEERNAGTAGEGEDNLGEGNGNDTNLKSDSNTAELNGSSDGESDANPEGTNTPPASGTQLEGTSDSATDGAASDSGASETAAEPAATT